MIGINVGVPAPMAWFPFTGWNKSFFGDLHIQGTEGVQFYTQQKMTLTRWFKSPSESHVDPIWKTKAGRMTSYRSTRLLRTHGPSPITPKPATPAVRHQARAVRRPGRKPKCSPCGSSTSRRADHVLPRSAAGRRREDAVPLGRDGQAVPRRLRRHRHRLGRPLPSVRSSRRCASRSASCSTRRRSTCIRRSAQFGKKLAEHMPAESGLSVIVLHQLRQRGERAGRC